MIFSKSIYLFSLFFLFLSCNSEKSENQNEVIATNSAEKTEIKKQVLEELSIIKEGDIIFQTSLSSQSKAIQLATNSKYSHIEIIFKDKSKIQLIL